MPASASTYSYNPTGRLITDALEHSITQYGHDMDAEVGFKGAALTIEDNPGQIEDWIDNGLNRHIAVYNPAGDVVFEGFVNSLSANIGPVTYERGPVLDVMTRMLAIYTPVDYSASPPAKGPPMETTAADNEEAQRIYGILEGVLQAGEDTQVGAERARDTQLRDFSAANKASSVNTSGNNQPSVSIDVLGYGARLDRYIYNDATVGGIAISDKLGAALDADPNGLFSTERDYLESNPVLVAAEEDDNRTAWTVIKALLPAGMADDRRTFFGIYEGRTPRYWSEPADVRYKFRIADVNQDVLEHAGGTVTQPWDVRPGYWVFLPDFLAGRVGSPVDLRNDPRVFLIEAVKYTAPYTVEFNGKRFGSIPQLLAKKGLGSL